MKIEPKHLDALAEAVKHHHKALEEYHASTQNMHLTSDNKLILSSFFKEKSTRILEANNLVQQILKPENLNKVLAANELFEAVKMCRDQYVNSENYDPQSAFVIGMDIALEKALGKKYEIPEAYKKDYVKP